MTIEDRPTAQQLQNRTMAAERGNGLLCPNCGCGNFENDGSRRLPTGTVRRYIECRNCHKRYLSVQPPPRILREIESKTDEDERPVLKVRTA